MMIRMVLIWAVVIGSGLWLLLSWSTRSNTPALEVLRARLARGGIDVPEFERRAAALGAGDARRARVPLLAACLSVALLVTVPTIIMASNDWDMDMWNMHDRGRNTSAAPIVRGGSNPTVRIEDFAFVPGNLEIPVGGTVTWINNDSAAHDATDRRGNWSTGRLSEGEEQTLTFDGAGAYDYYCSIHPGMKARLTVRALGE